ncbi:alpha/beta hydrolase [Robiginitalea aurantiaca]|uniref:Alpha/beta hydrolase-fold protein n=1 Tax=Robiginitalea aurantiaca TaxID=3056915 RepID=A0ABT7WEF5_9FLAO|nr:alpha/beta hydrolase-fold protein [Robiginitalea aurantiaca]MDM9631306.1 alpha/beta hydrolase-fold protein [Robiginitalea aurantiaca]
MKRLFLIAIGLWLATPVKAQVKEEIFESFKLQERRNVRYYIPEGYNPDKRYPLVIVLDGDYLFDQVVATSKFHSRFQGMPETLVVGIGQSEGDLRSEDCEYELTSGLPAEKGKKFFEFIGMEIVPYMVSAYNVAPFKMFVGYDITANFGNYYLFKERSIFDAFISISPDLAPEMETRVPARLAAIEQPIFYHLIAEGDLGEEEGRFAQLNTALGQIEKEHFTYHIDRYPEANEVSIATFGIGTAWERTFDIFKPISPEEYRKKILASEEPAFNYLENKYQTIQTIFGFSKPVELNDIMAIYAACRKKDDFESLKPLSDLCKQEYPETMLGFYFEGEYYEQIGEPKKALKTFEKAFGMEEIDFLTKDMAIDKMDALKADFGF